VPGPFHRIESPTQKVADAIQQQSSNEIWGKPPGNTAQSNLPCVKAYRNSLPSGQRGIDFDTPVHPTPGGGSPLDARWYLGTMVFYKGQILPEQFTLLSPCRGFFNGQP
jgi:hypothetical protein